MHNRRLWLVPIVSHNREMDLVHPPYNDTDSSSNLALSPLIDNSVHKNQTPSTWFQADNHARRMEKAEGTKEACRQGASRRLDVGHICCMDYYISLIIFFWEVTNYKSSKFRSRGHFVLHGIIFVCAKIRIPISSSPCSANLSLAILNCFANGLTSSNISIRPATISRQTPLAPLLSQSIALNLLANSFAVSYTYSCAEGSLSDGKPDQILWTQEGHCHCSNYDQHTRPWMWMQIKNCSVLYSVKTIVTGDHHQTLTILQETEVVVWKGAMKPCWLYITCCRQSFSGCRLIQI
jgi:hypothetical protein